eukprot:g9163.t1
MENNDGLSRKEKLALWRAQRTGTGATGAAAGPSAGGGEKGKGKAIDSSRGSGTGVLAERASNSSAGKIVPGKKRAGSHVAASKGERGRGAQRKPFQVDARRVREASERRVAPGTPIHSLKKRLKRTGASQAAKPAPAPFAAAAGSAAATTATAGAASSGASAVIPTARAQAKAKAAAAARVPGHVNGVRRSLDAARTKEVSDYLKSQISEANMLMEISGVDAARTLLADLLPCTDAARGVGELALYWAARAKLEEDAGEYVAARQLLDEGEAYISMATQQKVMAKVMASFEGRMNDREEVEVARLLEDSVGSMSLNDSGANSNSPASSAPFRYDPNDLSVGDDDDSGSPRSAIKNLNFSKITRESESGSATSTTTRNGSPSAFSPDLMREAAEADQGEREGGTSGGSGSNGGGGIASMSGVIYSDDESDLSVVSDIDEGVIARAKAFAAEEEARKARMNAVEEGLGGAEESLAARDNDERGRDEDDNDSGDTNDARKEGEGEGEEDLDPAPDDNEQRASSQDAGDASAADAILPAPEPVVSNVGKKSTSSIGRASSSSASCMAMAPPPPQPATMAMASREPRKRKGTPHPKPHVKRTTPRRGKKASQDVSPGSFIAQVEATGKDGKRTLTPVRRSRRISGASTEATPAYLRKEMEAML